MPTGSRRRQAHGEARYADARSAGGRAFRWTGGGRTPGWPPASVADRRSQPPIGGAGGRERRPAVWENSGCTILEAKEAQPLRRGPGRDNRTTATLPGRNPSTTFLALPPRVTNFYQLDRTCVTAVNCLL